MRSAIDFQISSSTEYIYTRIARPKEWIIARLRAEVGMLRSQGGREDASYSTVRLRQVSRVYCLPVSSCHLADLRTIYCHPAHTEAATVTPTAVHMWPQVRRVAHDAVPCLGTRSLSLMRPDDPVHMTLSCNPPDCLHHGNSVLAADRNSRPS